jgi:hypothetical protein
MAAEWRVLGERREEDMISYCVRAKPSLPEPWRSSGVSGEPIGS